MALSRKLLATLNEENEPLPKRLKIADNAFKYVDLPIQKREVFLVRWLIDLQVDDGSVWHKLFEWISSVNMKNLNKNDLNEDDFIFINNVIVERLNSMQNNSYVKEYLKKMLFILIENHTFQFYYERNLKLYFNVLSNLIDHTDCQDELVKIMKNDFLINLGHTSKESYSALLEFIIGNLSNAFVKFESTGFDNIVEFLQKCLFYKSLSHYDNYYKELFDLDRTGESHYGPKLFFKKLKSVYKLDVKRSTFLYKALLRAYYTCAKNDHLSTYKFMIFLIESIGFDLSNTISISKIEKIRLQEVKRVKSIAILSNLFEVLSLENFDTEITVADVTASMLFQNLLQYLLKLNCSPSYVSKIVKHVIVLNPLIIETLINDVLTFILFNVDEESKSTFEELFINVMEVYLKLQRIQNLISKLIKLMKAKLTEDKATTQVDYKVNFTGSTMETIALNKDDWNPNEILPENVLSYFTKCITPLASWQVMNLFKTFLFHLNEFVDDNVKQDCGNGNLIYVELLSMLMCQYLSSVRMAEHTVSTLVVDKFVSGMEELRDILGKFGSSLLLMEHNHVLMGAFLNIAYSWAELYIVLGYYSTDELKPKLVMDKDHSCFNIVYLHSYLTAEQWHTLSQRITNFGEKPCNQTLHKLVIQKLKAILMYERDIDDEIMSVVINDLTLNIEDNAEILCDTFCLKYIVPKFSTEQINFISSIFLRFIIENETQFPIGNIAESNLITNGILFNILTGISKCIKSKKTPTRIANLLGAISQQYFVNTVYDEDCAKNIRKVIETFDGLIIETDDNSDTNLKFKTDKIVKYLGIIKTLPLPYMTKYVRTVTFVYLWCLWNELKETEKEDKGIIQREIEVILIGVAQSGSLCHINETNSSVMITFLLNNVNRYEELFKLMIDTIFKTDESASTFKTGIEHLANNVENEKYLRCALIVLNEITRLKKQHISMDHKKILDEYKTKLCDSLETLILNSKSRSVDAFTSVLKLNLSNSDNKLEQLLKHLDLYVDLAIKQMREGLTHGPIELFSIILNNKSQIKSVDDDFVKRTWDVCKDVSIVSKTDEDTFCKLIMVIFDHVSNEDFTIVTQELLRSTLKPLEEGDYDLFSKRMNIWNVVLMCSFNVVKCKHFQEILQMLLQILIHVNVPKNTNDYDRYYGNVLNLINNLIRKTQLPLTPSIIDVSLLSVTVVIKHFNDNNFIVTFKLTISILESLLKCRSALIMDRLPSFLQQYRVILNVLCDKSNSEVEIDFVDLQNLSNCAHLFEKLTRNIVDCGKYVKRISAYLITDILKRYETVTLYPSVKLHLNNCLYNWLKLCDQHVINYLLRILSTASTEIFKIIYDDYKKHYRFTGKV